jgi:aubergine
VDSVDFSKTPIDCFTTKQGEKSYVDYYKEKYNKVIRDTNQPLLISKDLKKNTIIHLIPEFCYLTGLTDEMRSNFNLMKQMATITKGNPGEKMKECITLINTFLNNEKCKQDIENWGITLSNQPVTLTGRKLDAGNILMHKQRDGSRFNFSIDTSDDIDRKIQTEMFSQPSIRKWLVFSTSKDKESTENFLQIFKKVQESFNYQIANPNVVFVKSTQYRDWEEAITRNIAKDVQAVLLIIPGAKGKGFIYNDVKKLLTLKFPVPSQVVLASTLMKRKIINNFIFILIF